jgi:hypothetical protein
VWFLKRAEHLGQQEFEDRWLAQQAVEPAR